MMAAARTTADTNSATAESNDATTDKKLRNGAEKTARRGRGNGLLFVESAQDWQESRATYFQDRSEKAENLAKKGEKIRKKDHTFSISDHKPRKRKTITRKNHLNRNKTFIFALDETHPSLFPSPCGVHIAQSRGTSPMNRRKRSLTL